MAWEMLHKGGGSAARLLPLAPTNYFQTFKIQDCTDIDQEIHAKNPIDLEAIVHETYFDFKIFYFQVSQCDSI